MSEQNVALHRRIDQAYTTGDVEGWLALCDPNIECRSAFALGGVYHGHEGIRRWFADLREAWGDEIHLEPEAYFDLGDQTLTFNVVRGRGRHSEVEVAMKTAQVLTWRDGLCVFLKGLPHQEGCAQRSWPFGGRARATRPVAAPFRAMQKGNDWLGGT